MSVRTYNPSVRVGNWNEDIQLEEDTLKDFMEKREKGQLLAQKRNRLEETIFKKIDLSISRDGCVHYGDHVSLRCPGARDKTRYLAHKTPRENCNLTVCPQVEKILEAQKLEGICQTSASTELNSNLRSSFVIKSIKGELKGEKLLYGDPFYLCTLDNEGGDLYLASDRATFGKAAKKSRNQEVTFVGQPSFLTVWRVLHKDPQLRLENEGVPVPANAVVLINHKYTNNDLALEEECLMRTPFGTREYEISCHTYLDSHRAETDINHWMIMEGVPGEDTCPFINKE